MDDMLCRSDCRRVQLLCLCFVHCMYVKFLIVHFYRLSPNIFPCILKMWRLAVRDACRATPTRKVPQAIHGFYNKQCYMIWLDWKCTRFNVTLKKVKNKNSSGFVTIVNAEFRQMPGAYGQTASTVGFLSCHEYCALGHCVLQSHMRNPLLV